MAIGLTHRCPICGELFFPRRADARYCGPTCRKAANRAGIRAQRIRGTHQIHFQVAEREIKELAALGAQGSLRALVVTALNYMDEASQDKIKELLK